MLDRPMTFGDLIIDLECVLRGDPPKLARQRIDASALQELEDGAATEEDDDRRSKTPSDSVPFIWVAVIGGVLALSLILNLIQFLRS